MLFSEKTLRKAFHRPTVLGMVMLLGITGLLANVTSRTGSVTFDVNRDGQKEATLSTGGLKIGTGTASANLHVGGNSIITGSVAVGSSTAPSSNLYVAGSVSMSVYSAMAGTSVIDDSSVVLANTSSGNVFISLPDPRVSAGRMVTVKRVSTSNNLTIGGGGGNIEGYESVLEIPSGSQLPSYVFVSDGTQWFIMSSLLANPTEANSSLSDNLILRWDLNETSGNVVFDSSGSTNTYTGNLSNNHHFSGNSVAGAHYTGLQFDDLADTAERLSSGNILVDAYSWSLWVKMAVDPSVAPSVAPEDPPLGALGYSFVSSNVDWRNVVFHRKANDELVGANVNSFNVGSWNHIAATWDGTTLSAYHNGTLTDTEAVADLSTQAGNIILQHPGDDAAVVPSVDDLKIYDRALSSEEIQVLYLGGSTE